MATDKMINIQIAEGVNIRMSQSIIAAMPTGSSLRFGAGFTSAELKIENPTPAEARALSPPQRREQRAHNALVREEKITAPVTKEPIRTVLEGAIQKAPRKSVFQRMTAASTSQAPVIDVQIVDGKPQAISNFPTTLLTKRARKNLARRKKLKERRAAAGALKTENSFEVLSDHEGTAKEIVETIAEKKKTEEKGKIKKEYARHTGDLHRTVPTQNFKNRDRHYRRDARYHPSSSSPVDSCSS